MWFLLPAAGGAVHEQQGFESGLGTWTIEGGVWEVGVPTAANGPAAFAGTNVAGTVLAGNYGPTHDARLITPEFVVPAADQAPRFTYHYWYLIGANDYGQLQMRTPGGAWQDIAGERLTEAGGGSWARRSLDLRAFAGQTVQLAFRFVAAFNNSSGDLALGWYIDDARLESGPAVLNSPEGFEGGFGDWSAEGGVWQVGTPGGTGAPTPFAGTKVAGTILAGNYGAFRDARLVTPEFVVPAADQAPRFTYHYWYLIGVNDYGQLQMRTVGGDWQDVPGERLTEASGGAWSRRSVDLRAFAGQTVQLGFRLVASFNNSPGDLALGWYIDEAGLETGPMELASPEGFESGFGDWSAEGGVWQVGTPSVTGAPTPFAGTKAAGTILAGNYGFNRDARLVTPEFTVPAAADDPRFTYRYWYAIGGLDYGQLQIREVGGAWQDIAGERLTETGGAWARRSVDLRPFAGRTVQLAFHLVAVYQNRAGDLGRGWYVDEAALETGPMNFPADGFEGGFGDWSAEGGVWQVGAPAGAGAPAPFAGANVAATILNGNYGTTHDARLVTPEFTVPAATETPRFSYQYWYSFGILDHLQLEVRPVGGAWQAVAGERLAGVGGRWARRSVDLRAFAGQTVQLAFRLVSVFENRGGDLGLGLYVDEPRLETGPMAFVPPEGFENGFGDWSAEGGVWQIGTPSGAGSPVPFAGSAVAGTILDGSYPVSADARLVSPEFLVPPAVRAPQLSFQHWRAIQNNDGGRFEISVAGGPWIALSGLISGTDTGWRRSAYDLTPYAGQPVRVAFHFTSDAFVVSLGWYLDDVQLGTVEPAVLPLGTNVTGNLPATGARALYVLEVPPGGHLRFTLDDLDNVGANEIYVRRGGVPTAGAYDYRFTSAGADQSIFAPQAGAGAWFVLLIGANVPGGGNAYRLRADFSQEIALASVTPRYVGNGAPATLRLTGAGFDATAQVELRSNATVVATGTATFISAEELIARFELGGVPPGTYDVAVTQGGQTATIPLAVREGERTKFEARLIVPGRVGRHGLATIFVEYANTGDVALAAPLLVVRGSDRPLLTLDPTLSARGLYANTYPAGFSDSVQLLAQGEAGGLLLPGERRRASVYYAGLLRPWNTSDRIVSFDLRVFAPPEATPLDWAAAKPIVAPVNFTPAEWDGLFDRFRAGVGGTWGQYVAMVARNAGHLQRCGVPVSDISELIALEFAAADGLGPIDTLSAATDLFVEQPGVPLVFARVYPQAINRRQRRGTLGFGWSHNWAWALTATPGGDVTITQPDGARLEFQPDLRGGFFREAGERPRLTRLAGGRYQLTAPDGLALVFRADGLLDYLQDLNGNRITAAYTGGRLTGLAHTAGASLALAYAGDLLQSVTASTGRAIAFGYDGAGRLSSATSDGVATLYGYDARHFLTSVVRPSEPEERFAFDARGRLAAIESGCCEVPTTFSYPHAGLVLQTDAAGTRQFHYDQHGLLVKLVDPLGREVRATRNPQLQITSVTAPGGSTTRYHYDALGNLAGSTDPRGAIQRLWYTGHGRLGVLRDARGFQTSFGYDAAGNHTAVVHPNNSAEIFQHDALGQLAVARNRRGQMNTFTRDGFGRVTRKVTAEGRAFDYTYDEQGNLSRVDDSTLGPTTLTYDAHDRLLTLTYPGGRGFTFTYDAAGRRTSSLTHDGHRLVYEYDTLGRLQRLVDGAGAPVVTYTYDAAGRLAREDHGNGTATTYTHDAASQVTSVTHLAPGGAVLSQFTYTYDLQGRRTSVTTAGGTTAYAYDSIGQLVSVTRPGGSVTRYTYDADGNRSLLFENGTNTASAANLLDQISNAGAATFTYDADGNLSMRTDASGTTTFTWDSENQLVALNSPVHGAWQFVYDAFGRRVATTHNGQTTTALHDPAGLTDLVAEYDEAGNLRARYDHGHGLARRLAADGTTAHYHFDAVGHTRELTDGAGAVVNRYDYGPFGALPGALETVSNPFTFVGRFGVLAAAPDLLQMRARYYSPGLGRFLSVDPLRLADPLANAYRYAANDPVSLIDPDGLAVICSRPLNGRADMGRGPLSDWANLERLHQQIFFDKPQVDTDGMFGRRGRAWDNIGFFSDDGSVWTPGMGIYIEERRGWYGRKNCDAKQYDDERLWRAMQKAGPWNTYNTIGHNCQNWIEEVIEEYEKLEAAESAAAAAVDPNDLVPPAGHGPANYLRGDRMFAYRVNFENDRTATAPAQVVEIVNPLPAHLDLATLEFTSAGFGEVTIPVPSGSQRFEHTETMTFEGVTFDVVIELSVDAATREVRAKFSSILPETGLPPGVETGFLPPEDDTGRGLGHVGYVVAPMAGLPTDTEIRNVGFVTFDRLAGGPTYRTDLSDPHDPTSAPSADRQALVTIDADGPVSAVTALPMDSATPDFAVAWSGSDAGAGVVSYDVYVQTDGGEWVRWLADTPLTSAVWNGDYERSYGFYAVATDGAGWQEASPSSGAASQAGTRVLPRTNFLRILAADGAEVRLEFVGAAGDRWRIERASAPTGIWEELGTITVEASGRAPLLDSAPIPGAAFYRATRQPAQPGGVP